MLGGSAELLRARLQGLQGAQDGDGQDRPRNGFGYRRGAESMATDFEDEDVASLRGQLSGEDGHASDEETSGRRFLFAGSQDSVSRGEGDLGLEDELDELGLGTPDFITPQNADAGGGTPNPFAWSGGPPSTIAKPRKGDSAARRTDVANLFAGSQEQFASQQSQASVCTASKRLGGVTNQGFGASPPSVPVKKSRLPLGDVCSQGSQPMSMFGSSQEHAGPRNGGAPKPPSASARPRTGNGRGSQGGVTPQLSTRAVPRGSGTPSAGPMSLAKKLQLQRRQLSPTVNENPFTVATPGTASPGTIDHGPPSVASLTSDVSRYRIDFEEVSSVGKGSFGHCFHVKRRLDGQSYCVKRKKLRGAKGRPSAEDLREVYALAHVNAGAPHAHVLRYYGSWQEVVSLYVQTELCPGGSLASAIGRTMKSLEDTEQVNIASDGSDEALRPRWIFPESDCVRLLRQLAGALAHIHSCGVAHLDLKPENILLGVGSCNCAGCVISEADSSGVGASATPPASPRCSQPLFPDARYVLSDFGLATRTDGQLEVDEGDCRYMAPELLNRSGANAADGSPLLLDRADIFSLGATIFELAGGVPLPNGGPKFEDLRRGRLVLLPNVTAPLQQLLRRMMHPVPQQRPSAAELLLHPLLVRRRRDQ